METDRLLERYFDEVTASAMVLHEVETAAQAEAWASGAVSEWLHLGGSGSDLQRRLEDVDALAAGLVGWLTKGRLPTSGPAWIADIGTDVAVDATRLVGPNETAVVVTFRAESGATHDMSATLLDGALSGASVGPAGLVEAVEADAIGGMAIRSIAPAEGQRLIGEAVAASDPTLLSDSSAANLPLMARRCGVVSGAGAAPVHAIDPPKRDADDDRYAADLVWSAVRRDAPSEPPPDMAGTIDEVNKRLEVRDPDVLSIFVIAALEPKPLDQPEELASLAGAYLSPHSLEPHRADEAAAIADLEPADWAGAVLGIVRADADLVVDGDALVTAINRCPEIATTIPKRDAPRVAWAFDQTLYAWELLGVI
ncbi:MAG: hypothetical protein ACR2P0_05925, partial [Acidimicrobiales bacterium]